MREHDLSDAQTELEPRERQHFYYDFKVNKSITLVQIYTDVYCEDGPTEYSWDEVSLHQLDSQTALTLAG